MPSQATPQRRLLLRTRAAAVVCAWALSCPFTMVPASASEQRPETAAAALTSALADNRIWTESSRKAVLRERRALLESSTSAPVGTPRPPVHSGLTPALPEKLRQSLALGVSAESSDTAGIESASAALSVQGTLNVDGPAELALVTELQVPDAKLAVFQTACFNPTIPGYENVTAAERDAAAAALGITVPAWKTGQKAYFDLNPVGNTDSNPYWLPCHRDHTTAFKENNANLPAVQWPFILYGDSLTEIWKGTMGCKPSSQRAGFDALRQQYLSPLSNADGMSGESGWNTMWRVLNGEAPAPQACPKLIQVYSGTNDFAASHVDAGYNCGPAYASLVANRTIQILQALQTKCPSAHFILRGLGPKTAGAGIWPNLFTVGNQQLNYLLKTYADSTPNVHYLVCGWAVGAEGYLRMTVPSDLSAACRANPTCLASSLAQIRIDRGKLVDGIHPTRAGMEIQGRCMADLVMRLLGWNSASGSFVGPSPPPMAPTNGSGVGTLGADGKVHYHSAAWYIKQGLPVPPGVAISPNPTPMPVKKPTAPPTAPKPTPKPASKPAKPSPPPENGFPAVLGTDGQYHFHTAAWWLKNWYTVPGVPPPEDGHPAILGPDGKWHYHSATWWADQG